MKPRQMITTLPKELTPKELQIQYYQAEQEGLTVSLKLYFEPPYVRGILYEQDDDKVWRATHMAKGNFT